MDYNNLGQGLAAFYLKVLAYLRPHLSVNEAQRLAANASTIAMEYGKAHPYHTAFTVVSVGLTPFLGAGWMAAPLLKLVGFGPLGPLAGEKRLSCCARLSIAGMIHTTGGIAAWCQATWLGGYIPAGGIFATFQSWAMTLAQWKFGGHHLQEESLQTIEDCDQIRFGEELAWQQYLCSGGIRFSRQDQTAFSLQLKLN